jgi:WD40-like Beta Propeller Repeat
MGRWMKTLRGKDCLIFAGILVALFFSSSCQQYINYPAPVVTGVSPTNVNAGQPAFTLTVVGSNFTPASTVLWNGFARVSFFQDSDHITANILQSDVVNPGRVQVTVETPQPGGGIYQPPATFTINPVAVPVPTIASLTPSGVYASTDAFTLRVNGANFVSTSIVTINGANRTTSEVNSTQLVAAVSAADIANAGALQIAVFNPPVPNPPAGEAPGGGSSNMVALNVTNPVPTISQLSPEAALINSGPSTFVSITGSGLVPDSVLLINGSPRTTAFASNTSISGTLTAGDVASSGVAQLQVMNPPPGGGTSNILTFTVDPSLTAGLPELLDYGYDGSVANSGVCGTNCASGTPNLSTAGPALNQSGTTVAFSSVSSNLVLNQKNSSSQIFTRNTCLGSSQCTSVNFDASVGPDGAVANGASTEPSLSSSGTDLVYTSTATNLTNYAIVPAGHRQVYWEPVCGSSATCAGAVLVSMGADGSPGNGDSYGASISPDGNFVAFVSLATNLVSGVTVDGSTPQVYVRTICSGATPNAPNATCTPTTYLVSANYAGNVVTPGNAPSTHPSVASGGGFVAFQSSATNLGSAAPNPSAQQQVFVQQVCQILTTGCTSPFSTIASTPDGVTPANADAIEPVISSDGRFVAFASTATNLGYQTGGFQQVFVRDTCETTTTGLLINGSCSPKTALASTLDGTTAANGLSENPSLGQNCSASSTTSCTSGPVVAFATQATNLGSNVVTGIENIFVRNTCLSAQPGTACSTNTRLASAPAGVVAEPSNGNSIVPAISGDGRSVAFLSAATNMVSGVNTGGLEHVYLGATSF